MHLSCFTKVKVRSHHTFVASTTESRFWPLSHVPMYLKAVEWHMGSTSVFRLTECIRARTSDMQDATQRYDLMTIINP